MLIDFQRVKELLTKEGIDVKGALHIGAHECEELPFYTNTLHMDPNNIVWIDALQNKVDEMKQKGIPNVYQAVISNKDNDTVTFHVTNNVQSSSILEFGTHAVHHHWVKNIAELTLQTTTIDSFFAKNNLNPEDYTFWNLDIQGAELMALEGGTKALQYAKALYLEVNEEELYKGCALMYQIDTFLMKKGFVRVETKMTEFHWGDALYLRI